MIFGYFAKVQYLMKGSDSEVKKVIEEAINHC